MKTLIRGEEIVATKLGRVKGAFSDDVYVFKGIPYAEPPFGSNRFKPPQPLKPWDHVRDALTFGAKVPQVGYPPPWDVLLAERGEPGEDCLSLNIWTRDLAASQPVMVWIHGGMFESGAGATYDGSRFARDGVVCVTINFRVGADGFLYLGKDSANLGLLDQVATLKWVRENIASFGGNPENVTIFGESSGAMCIATLLSMPLAEGLFQRAIVESGGAQQVISLDSARKVRERFAEKLGVAESREAFASVPLQRFIEAQAELKADLMSNPDPRLWGREVPAGMLPWQPVIDGDTIPGHPLDRIAAGAGAKVDVLCGSNLEESNLFLVPLGAIDRITPEVLSGAIAAYGLPVEKGLEAYRTLRPGAGDGTLLSAIQSDWLFRMPAQRLAEAHSMSGGKTYLYEFAWRSDAFDGRLGACHGLEIPFVFDAVPDGPDPLLGSAAPKELAARMHSAWVSFASTGDPGWPRFDIAKRQTMRFDTHSKVVDDPMLAERTLWMGVR